MFGELLKDFERVKVGKKEIEIWKLKDRIKDGESHLGIDHRELDTLSNDQLGEYLTELRAKWKRRDVASGTAGLPEVVSLNIPSGILELADRVGKKYGITGQQICDRYLQVCKRSAFDKDAIADLRDNVLLDIDGKEESWEAAFVKPIKAGVLNESMKPEPKHNPTPDISELPKFEDAVPLIETALKAGMYPLRPFGLYETEHEQYSVISFADTAKRYLKRPEDAKARELITMLAWHLRDAWWRS